MVVASNQSYKLCGVTMDVYDQAYCAQLRNLLGNMACPTECNGTSTPNNAVNCEYQSKQQPARPLPTVPPVALLLAELRQQQIRVQQQQQQQLLQQQLLWQQMMITAQQQQQNSMMIPTSNPPFGLTPPSTTPLGLLQLNNCFPAAPTAYPGPQATHGQISPKTDESDSENRINACSSSGGGKGERTRSVTSRYRVPCTADQLAFLEQEFQRNQQITIERRAQLTTLLGMTERQLKYWFQNRRAKFRKRGPIIKGANRGEKGEK